jgi:predicted transcriptional regulator
MDALFRLGTASVADVLSALDDPPTYNSIRTTLGILEKKGLVAHHKEGARFIYRTRESAARTGPGLLKNMVRTFFGGSAPKAVAALLDDSTHVSEAEYIELKAALDKARRRDGQKS